MTRHVSTDLNRNGMRTQDIFNIGARKGASWLGQEKGFHRPEPPPEPPKPIYVGGFCHDIPGFIQGPIYTVVEPE